MSTEAELAEALKRRARAEGFDPVGLASASGSPRLQARSAALQRWLEAGHQADMHWMASPRRQRIEHLMPEVQSVLAVALPYRVSGERRAGSLAVARYGWGRDYHRVIDQRLRRIGHWLSSQRPDARWRACVDSAPLMDKAWAEEAGLGWIGKNGNLIHPERGSWLLIGHLLLSLPLPADPPALARCGACTLCITACPTGAIPEPFVVDSRRCIAYHTIENRDPELPGEIEAAMGPWVAGCDICQEVCPWNGARVPLSTDPELQPRSWMLALTRQQVMEWSDSLWDQRLRASALRRIKPWMWRRNARHSYPPGRS
ncbi:tRNA epoxyqueuosine(34) reductase QueG [Synechococcus sp. RSCCF101]|uniref:tRNA epoxyqueuosine(34) reductase QueG n=1 Tax=Synechococcus sp. RSCCF101 TaxID=2511069 RepID=UPI00124497AE|nr:tRNA epoxyqueuosine(34) reductase QueG [Synechococcus sp. RSCCF101]QEY32578.1 tRNA epoxyqueuosine(34) reductase QueG [Synechococcus sp. RSCCF101]